MILIDTPTTYITKAKASGTVDLLNKTDDACGWTYAVKEHTGMNQDRRFTIEVTDEDGLYLGAL